MISQKEAVPWRVVGLTFSVAPVEPPALAFGPGVHVALRAPRGVLPLLLTRSDAHARRSLRHSGNDDARLPHHSAAEAGASFDPPLM